MRIIVNADDLGSSRRVNAAIFGLMAAGRIRSATLIPNGRALEEAVSRLRQFPRSSFGIHLNVADGPPVGSVAAASPLLGADGCFRLEVLQKVYLSRETRAAALQEWRSQAVRMRDAGVSVSHIDSHHHLHTVPALFGALKALQRESGIGRVRRARCRRKGPSPATIATCLVRTIWNRALRLDGTKTTDAFCSLPEFRKFCDGKYPRFATVEIMVHAGTKAGEEDVHMLESDWWTQQMREHELISYNEL